MASAPYGQERYDIGRVLGKTFSAITDNWLVLGGFSLAVSVASALVNSVQMQQSIAVMNPTDPVAGLRLFSSPLYWVAMVAGVLAGAFLQAGLIHSIFRRTQGQAASFGDCLSGALRHVLPVFGLTFLWWLGLMVGMMLLIVPGLILLVMWSVAVPVLVNEPCGVTEAFGRSRALTKGLRWPIFGTLLIFTLILGVTSFAFQGFSKTGMMDLYRSSLVTGTVVSLVMFTLTSLFTSSFLAALYGEVRLVKDGVVAGGLAEIFS
jgi:hypothetical protein